MPTGAFAGERAKYIYTSDDGVAYLITTTKILGDLADNGLTAYDPTSPGAVQPPPKRFKYRHVYWESSGGPYVARKKLICGTSTCNLYKSNTNQDLTIDSQAGYTTGRVGEKLTY